MSEVYIEILFIVLLILLNGLFALSEMAVVSSRKARLQQRANEGDDNARAALELANNPNDLLSTVQVGITLIGILAGAFGGATIAEELALTLHQLPFLAHYADAIALGIVVLVITFFSLIIGELVPKRVALNHPERIAAFVAKPMRMLAILSTPMVRLLGFATDFVLGILRMRVSTEPPVTEEEIKVLMEQGTRAGMFEEAEQDMVERVFSLGERRINTIMTPRTQIAWLDFDDPLEETLLKMTESAHSRFPVKQGTLDNFLGIVHVKDLMLGALAGKPMDLKSALHHPLFVPESMHVLKVLELFKKTGTHIGMVVNEYGDIQGLITLNDVLEAIVGGMPSLAESEEPLAVQRSDGSWLMDGMIPVDEFREFMDIADKLPGEESRHYHTLGGFVMSYLGRVPASADRFEWGGLEFEVMDMDGNRVDKILVTPAELDSVDILDRGEGA